MPLEEVDLAQFIQAIVLVFIAIDPIGNAPLFYAVTSRLTPSMRKKIIRRSIYTAFIILVVFALAGDILLYHFGLTLADFQIAGGIILLIYGIMGVLGQSEATMLHKPDEEVESIAIVPLATPLLAGPATIATVLYLKASSNTSLTLASILFNTLITYIMLDNSERILHKIGRNGSIALTKIMSIILTVFAVSLIRSGVEGVIAGSKTSKPAT